MGEWAEAASAALARGPVAMVSVIGANGSVPRGPGARMVVTAEDFSGSIGGGRLEWLALEQARKVLHERPGSWRIQDYPLGPLLGQCCGGRVRLLVERLDPEHADWLACIEPGASLVTHFGEERLAREVAKAAEPTSTDMGAQQLMAGATLVEQLAETRRRVLLFGAGHVGKAIIHASEGLPLDLRAYETRAEKADYARLVTDREAMDIARTADANAAILVMTHDHTLDFRLVAAALEGQAGFVGLIGSATKRARFLSSFRKQGLDATRLTCPIGLSQVPGKKPAVIAIAVLAQLLGLDAVQA